MADNTCQKAVLHRRQTQGPRILADPDAASQECLGEYVTLFYHSFEKPSTSFWDKGDVAESFLKMTHQLSPKTFPRMTASEVRNSASGKACWCAFSYVGLSCVLCFQWLNPSTRTSLMVQGWTVRLPVQEVQVQCLSWNIPWRRKWQPTPVLLPGKFHGQRSMEGCIVHEFAKESDMTLRLTTITLLLYPGKVVNCCCLYYIT